LAFGIFRRRLRGCGDANRWLDKKTGLTALLTPEAADSEVASYKVVVFTSDIRSAGTDANVTIRMFGEDGTVSKSIFLRWLAHRPPPSLVDLSRSFSPAALWMWMHDHAGPEGLSQ
jgi:hypothetical protein